MSKYKVTKTVEAFRYGIDAKPNWFLSKVKNGEFDEYPARINHENSLREIIEKSDEKGIRVPPGIHAELGNLLSESNRTDEAIAHFEVEMSIYPESKVFLERLLQNIKTGS